MDASKCTRALGLLAKPVITSYSIHYTKLYELQEAETRVARLNAEAAALRTLLTVGDPDLWPPMIDAVSVQPGS